MLVLALPAKSFQLYFNFIQSAYPNVIAYFRTKWPRMERERDTSLLSIICAERASFREARRGEGGKRSCTRLSISTTTAIVPPFRAESRLNL